MNDLHRIIREGLHCTWDPIGVQEFTDEMGEYDSYVDGICHLVSSRASEEVIFNYLWKLETSSMGLEGNKRSTKQFANWLASLNAK